jgi:hypothetical protein
MSSDRDVGAGAEAPGGAGDHECTHAAVVTGRVERVAQRDPQFGIDRVLAVRPVEGQCAHTVAVFGQQHGVRVQSGQ